MTRIREILEEAAEQLNRPFSEFLSFEQYLQQEFISTVETLDLLSEREWNLLNLPIGLKATLQNLLKIRKNKENSLISLEKTNYLQIVREYISKIPIIDNHCHNIAKENSSVIKNSYFSSFFSESCNTKSASFQSQYSICFQRSVRELCEYFNVKNNNVNELHLKRNEIGFEKMFEEILIHSNIDYLFVDDGLCADEKEIFSIDEMKKILKSTSIKIKRVIRVEFVALNILKKFANEFSEDNLQLIFDQFKEELTNHLTNEIGEEVVAYKSVAAYRSGLNISSPSHSDLLSSFSSTLTSLLNHNNNNEENKKTFKITEKPMIDFIFETTFQCSRITKKPIQIHTGFGDLDLDLLLANPLHLRSILMKYPDVPIVLLHASYPYSKEASYMASVYGNVYVDLGLAIPLLSVAGMKDSLKSLLSLSPLKKILFSTDAHSVPDLFYVGYKWGRDVLSHVLSKAVLDGDFTLSQSFDVANDILFRNSFSLYLNQSSPQSLNQIDDQNNENNNNDVIVHAPNNKLKTSKTNPKFEEEKIEKYWNEGVRYLRLMWCDGAGIRRIKSIRLESLNVKEGVGLTEASMGFPAHADGAVEGSGLTPIGEIRLIPDLESMVIEPFFPFDLIAPVDMMINAETPWTFCPRSFLKKKLDELRRRFSLELFAGFENEFFLVKEMKIESGNEKELFTDESKYAQSSTVNLRSEFCNDVANALARQSIIVQLMHPESGPGQYEIVLQYNSALLSADQLLFARGTIQSIAKKHNMEACFLPKPFADQVGSGCHVHLSLWKDGVNIFGDKNGPYGLSEISLHFIGGIFHHFPALLALISPSVNSTARFIDNFWSGSKLCWGIENREAPIRITKIFDNISTNFEIKTFDSTANPYLALGIIVAAGMDGIDLKRDLPKPVQEIPSKVEGLTSLPSSPKEAYDAFVASEFVKKAMGTELFDCIAAVRKAECDLLGNSPVSDHFRLLRNQF